MVLSEYLQTSQLSLKHKKDCKLPLRTVEQTKLRR